MPCGIVCTRNAVCHHGPPVLLVLGWRAQARDISSLSGDPTLVEVVAYAPGTFRRWQAQRRRANLRKQSHNDKVTREAHKYGRPSLASSLDQRHQHQHFLINFSVLTFTSQSYRYVPGEWSLTMTYTPPHAPEKSLARGFKKKAQPRPRTPFFKLRTQRSRSRSFATSGNRLKSVSISLA